MTTENKPKVTMLIGKKRTFKTGLINLLIKTITAPAMIKTVQLAMVTVGSAQAKMARVTAAEMIGSNNLMITKL